MTDCQLNRANLSQANLRAATLDKCSLRTVNLHEADVSRIMVRECYLEGALLPEDPYEAFFRMAMSPPQTEQQMDLSWRIQQGQEIRSAGFVDLSHAELSKATHLIFTSLVGANLSYADLRGAVLTKTILRDANLSHANLEGAKLDATMLQGANLSYANLRNADLYYSEIDGSNLCCANLTDVQNWDAVFGNAANLSGAIGLKNRWEID